MAATSTRYPCRSWWLEKVSQGGRVDRGGVLTESSEGIGGGERDGGVGGGVREGRKQQQHNYALSRWVYIADTRHLLCAV